jgi:iron(III) transport system permease protein
LIATALDRVPTELEEASAIFGASRLATLRQVTMPLILPAFIASAIVAFLHSMIEFGTPGVLALPAGFHTVTTRIWSLFTYPPKPHIAAAASMPLLVITMLLLAAQAGLIGRRGYTVVGGRGQRITSLALGIWRWPVLLLCLLLLAIPVFLPIAALFQVAFTSGGDGLTEFGSWSLDNVHLVFVELSETVPSFANTLKLGLMTATAGTVLALALAYVVTRRSLPGSGLIGVIAMAPAAMPSIVLAVGMFVAYTRPPLVLYGTLAILLLAFVTIQTPFAFQQIRAALRGLHPELEEAARILGASRLQAVFHVVLPLLRPVLIATWCFIFAGAIRELSAAILLFTSDTATVPVLIYDLNEAGRVGPIAVLGLTLLVMTLSVVALANLISARGRQN